MSSGAVQPISSPVAKGKQTVTVQLPPKTPKSNLTSPKSFTPSRSSRTSVASPTSADVSSASSSTASPVFKQTRAKKLFTQFDLDHDHYLSLSEFSLGLSAFVSSLSTSDLQIDLDAAHVTQGEGGKVTLSAGQVDALWKETDLDGDGRVSLAEFQWRFAGGPDPRPTVARRPTVLLQTLKRVVKDASRMSLDDLRAILDAVYDGPNPRFKTVDLSKTEQVPAAVLKRLLTQTLQAEKEQAAAQKRPIEDWAQHCWGLGGLTQKDCDRLFAALDTKKSGRIDLGPIFALAAQKPGRAKGKKKAKANPDYPLTTVKEEHLRDFISDTLITHLIREQSALKARGEPHTDVRCHPPLDHWGDDDAKAKGLGARGEESGYKKTLFLSERTKVNGVVRRAGEDAGGGWAVLAAYRTEVTELKRVERLWHAVVELRTTEEVEGVRVAVKKSWRDGEVEINDRDELLREWKDLHGANTEDDELSIPPIA